jgi:hypothetical protein
MGTRKRATRVITGPAAPTDGSIPKGPPQVKKYVSMAS